MGLTQLCGICKEPTLYAKSARFNVSKLYHITLEAHKTLISVKLWTNADSNQEEEKRLCRELLSYLGLCRTTLHNSCQWLKSVSWNVSVQCPLCKPCPDKCLKKTDICIWHKQQGCRHPDCGHHISLIDFAASCKYSVHDAPSFCQGKLDPWTQALSDFEKGAGDSTQSVHRSTRKRPIEQLLSHSPVKPPEEKKLCLEKVKERVPKDEDLEWLSQEIAESWKPLGRRLQIAEAKLTAFHTENEQLSEKAYKMLLHWKQKEGPAATFEVLCDALCHQLVKRRDLASRILEWNE